MALLMGLIGLYGVIAYSVSQRGREIGIRMALGAEPRSVRRLILREGARLALLGIAIGLAGAVAAALAATFLPARHAAAVNLVDALRSE